MTTDSDQASLFDVPKPAGPVARIRGIACVTCGHAHEPEFPGNCDGPAFACHADGGGPPWPRVYPWAEPWPKFECYSYEARP